MKKPWSVRCLEFGEGNNVTRVERSNTGNNDIINEKAPDSASLHLGYSLLWRNTAKCGEKSHFVS